MNAFSSQLSGEIVLELAKNNIKTLNISVKNENLEDYFLAVTGGASVK